MDRELETLDGGRERPADYAEPRALGYEVESEVIRGISCELIYEVW